MVSSHNKWECVNIGLYFQLFDEVKSFESRIVFKDAMLSKMVGWMTAERNLVSAVLIAIVEEISLDPNN